ncbi:Arm DNA-binding domain-containing protein [Alteromonas sp. a30]|uniref:Arm DNA-binding domain-containing protein n=1 Tax=Alteromonas sp. a30 TaxID=2730917 RepID=UPI0022818B3D|nr:DUF3596 domain-containing protein [Alteromonas sp. a30]MCY7295786.1 DUF3596 domain-containing protein [Alteromonas sp. a30]
MTDQLKDYCRSFEGVSIHGKSIRIMFYYLGTRCIEPLKGVPVTKSNIKYASQLRATIIHEITTQKFDYGERFPHSKKAKQFSHIIKVPTISQAIEKWLVSYKIQVRSKQFNLVKKRCEQYILPKWGDRKIDSLVQSEIKQWRDTELTKTLSNKTINDLLTPLRAIFDSAHADQIISHNPFNHIKNLPRMKPDSPDPFDREEIAMIESSETLQVNEKHGLLFAIYSGLSVSEWMALAWEDVDLTKKQINVRRSVVKGEYAFTKNDGRCRTVELLEQAYGILLAQKKLTESLESQTVEVLQEDNRTIKCTELRFVFVNTATLKPFSGSNNFSDDFVKPFLNKCQIRYRSANQARHTHASQLLTAGIPERWICKQMGWSSISMLEKHYGKWMDSEMPHMSKTASKVFSNGSNSDPK